MSMREEEVCDVVVGFEMAETTTFLSNRYWVLRHGKSIPNERGIIVSSMVLFFFFQFFFSIFLNLFFGPSVFDAWLANIS